MIQPYLVFHNRIYKAIYNWVFRRCSTRILEAKLEEEQVKFGCVEDCKCRYSIEVLHVKSFSPSVEDDGSQILHFILIYYGLWVYDAIEREMEGVHYEFH